jgi:predicted PurR-regulated permease PerM
MHRAGTRAVSTVVVAVMALLAFVAIAPAASAKSDTAKFCDAVDTLQSKLDDVGSSNAKTFDKSTYKQAGQAFKNAAKSAPKKVKSAMNRIGSFLSSLGSGDAVAAAKALGSSNGKAYAKAIVTYTTYVATNCP